MLGRDDEPPRPRPVAIVATIEPVPVIRQNDHHPATLDDVLNSLLGLAPPSNNQQPGRLQRPTIQQPKQQQHPDDDDIRSASSRWRLWNSSFLVISIRWTLFRMLFPSYYYWSGRCFWKIGPIKKCEMETTTSFFFFVGLLLQIPIADAINNFPYW